MPLMISIVQTPLSAVWYNLTVRIWIRENENNNNNMKEKIEPSSCLSASGYMKSHPVRQWLFSERIWIILLFVFNVTLLSHVLVRTIIRIGHVPTSHCAAHQCLVKEGGGGLEDESAISAVSFLRTRGDARTWSVFRSLDPRNYTTYVTLAHLSWIENTIISYFCCYRVNV